MLINEEIEKDLLDVDTGKNINFLNHIKSITPKFILAALLIDNNYETMRCEVCLIKYNSIYSLLRDNVLRKFILICIMKFIS